MNQRTELRTNLALAKLLRDELRDAQFVVTQLRSRDESVISGFFGGAVTTNFEVESEETLDAGELKRMHDKGDWKAKLFWSKFSVRISAPHPNSRKRRENFENILRECGVLSDGHVGHALGGLLRGYYETKAIIPGPPEETVGVSKVEELWQYLVVDACLNTARRTASKLLRWASGEHIRFETCVLLGGVETTKSFTLANGVEVTRVANKSTDLDSWLPVSSRVKPSTYLGSTILRIPCTIGPGLWKPKKLVDERDSVSVISWDKTVEVALSWALEESSIEEMCRAISVICDVAVETPTIWIDYGEHSHFWERHRSSNAGTGEPFSRNITKSEITKETFKEAMRFMKLSREHHAEDEVQIALIYWIKSKASKFDIIERLIFLRTALEALYLNEGNQGESRFRLATRGAWYTGRNKKERQEYYDVLKKLYVVASTAVHTGRVKNKNTAESLLKKGWGICREGIIKRMKSREKPIWDEIVLGA